MRFLLKAMDGARQVVTLRLEAEDEAGACLLAQSRGLAVVSIARSGGIALPARRRAFPTTLFSIELLALLDAGLNIVEALQTLAEQETRPEFRRVLDAILAALDRGESISHAIEHHGAAFSPLYVATLRSSERTGDVKEALARYIAYEEEFDKVRRRALSALLYPAILTVVGSLVLLFLLFYVVPRFALVYADVAVELPLYSKLLLGLGQGLNAHRGWFALALVVTVAALGYACWREDWRSRALERLWRIPALGARMKVYQLGRLYRTLGMLLRAGIPALRALDMVAGLLPAAMRPQLARAATLLGEGRSLSVALTSTGLTTPVATRMMAVGERSGRMGELMDRIARFYDDMTARTVDAFTRVFEPVLMAVLALAVGLIVILMYMPIFELAGSLQ
jgi:general secretion pathway protein F